jgi:hypothetical protein
VTDTDPLGSETNTDLEMATRQVQEWESEFFDRQDQLANGQHHSQHRCFGVMNLSVWIMKMFSVVVVVAGVVAHDSSQVSPLLDDLE